MNMMISKAMGEETLVEGRAAVLGRSGAAKTHLTSHCPEALWHFTTQRGHRDRVRERLAIGRWRRADLFRGLMMMKSKARHVRV